MKIEITPTGRVRAAHELRVPLPASTVWGQMRDVAWFLTRDPLHMRVQRLDGAGPDAPWSSAPVRISHRFLGIGPDRVGRVLGWREGVGYAVSDLSRRPPGRRGQPRGFPHICWYKVVPEPKNETAGGRGACRLQLGVRGRWTARWVPRVLVRAWIALVLAHTALRLSDEFGAMRRSRDRRRLGA